MKEIITNAGRTYAVLSPKGCTVTMDDGTTLCEVPAGVQAFFVAMGGKVTLSDDAARVTELFKLAPQQRLEMLRGYAPAWLAQLQRELAAALDGAEYALAWMPAAGKLVIHTDRISDDKLATIETLLDNVLPENIEVARYNHNMEISWREINKYAHCVTEADLLAVNPDFANDLTSDGEWIYPLPALKYINQHHKDISIQTAGYWRNNKNLKKWSVELPSVVEAGHGFMNSSIEVFDGGFPKLVCPTYQYWAHEVLSQGENIFANATKLWYFRGYLSKARRLEGAFQNCQNLKEFHATLDSICVARNMFRLCQLDKPSTLRVLNSLPNKEYVDSIYTNLNAPRQEITMGIHIDHQNDEEVLAAIANAEAKGWTLTVQWNGTPTSGISLMDLEEIWCKVTESEYGEYTDENGKRVSLDWGHYVTDTSEYKLFFSLVEAEQYFKLTKIEQPAE